jgi:hypothetical protein
MAQLQLRQLRAAELPLYCGAMRAASLSVASSTPNGPEAHQTVNSKQYNSTTASHPLLGFDCVAMPCSLWLHHRNLQAE